MKSLRETWLDLRSRFDSAAVSGRLLRGASWNTVGSAVGRGLPILGMILIADDLGVQAYGELGILLSTVLLFSALAASGMNVTAARYVAAFRSSEPDRLRSILTLANLSVLVASLVLSAVLYGVAPWFSAEVLAAPELADELRWVALLLLMTAWNDAQTGALTGFEAFRHIAVFNVVKGLVAIVGMTAGVKVFGVLGAIQGLALGAVAGAAYNAWAIRHLRRRYGIVGGFAIEGRDVGLLYRFAMPALLAGVMIGPAHWAAAAILINQPGGYAEMGLFNAANQIFALVLFVPAMIATAALPIMSNAVHEKNPEAMRSSYVASVGSILLVVSPLFVIGVAASPLIMEMFGPEFKEGWPVLVLLLLASVFASFLIYLGNLFAAKAKMWTHFATNSVWAMLLVSGSLVLVRWLDWGAVGLACAVLFAYAVRFALESHLAKSIKG